MGPKNKYLLLYKSPFGLIAIVSLSIFIAETVSMFVIYSLGPFSSELTKTLFDSSLLLILLTPTLYFFVLRPMLLNITERKKAEERISRLNVDLTTKVAELEDVNKELESFIYSVSHDLRAPLRTMSAFVDFLREDYSERLDEQAKDYLTRISRSSAKMSKLIEDLLDLSRLSRKEVNWTEVDMSALAASIVSELRQADPGRSVATSIEDGLTASADPLLMQIVLSNLIGNAWKFTSKTEKAEIQFGTLEKDGKTVYYVRDKGAGFDPQHATKMFLPFHRLHPDTDFEGTGIGLSIVERIIRSHRGKVWAEGEIGKRATVYFTLGCASVLNFVKLQSSVASKNMVED